VSVFGDLWGEGKHLAGITEGDKAGYDLGADVPELQLGQTTDPAQLVHGDPAAIRLSASRLKQFSSAFDETATGSESPQGAFWVTHRGRSALPPGCSPAHYGLILPVHGGAMADRPHDVTDLYLAPVLLAVDAKIEELGRLDKDGLAYEVALESDSPDTTRHIREGALITTITHLIDTHHWEFSWDPRGLRATHDQHTLVLGIPEVFLDYLGDGPGR